MAVSPWLKPAGAGGVTILMYHAVRDIPGRFPVDTVSPAAFARHMEVVAANFPVVRFEDVPAALAERSGPRRVAITFDDGLRNFSESAYPVLRRLGLPATMFVPTGWVGQRGVMNVPTLQWLHHEGLVTFGSHTVDHVNMRAVDEAERRRQVVESCRQLETWLGAPVTTFAYPYGQRQDFCASTTAILSEAGIRAAATTCWGTTDGPDDALCLHRIVLREQDSPRALLAKINGAGDWRAVKERVAFRARLLAGLVPQH